MVCLSRRSFLGASLAGLAAPALFGADQPTEKTKQSADDPAFQPDTLFLTWQRDSTTTMTVEWVGTVGETQDPTISYAAVKGGIWQAQRPTAQPYPMTDFKVFRAELTGLTPATDYRFRIGRRSPTCRFRR